MSCTSPLKHATPELNHRCFRTWYVGLCRDNFRGIACMHVCTCMACGLQWPPSRSQGPASLPARNRLHALRGPCRSVRHIFSEDRFVTKLTMLFCVVCQSLHTQDNTHVRMNQYEYVLCEAQRILHSGHSEPDPPQLACHSEMSMPCPPHKD